MGGRDRGERNIVMEKRVGGQCRRFRGKRGRMGGKEGRNKSEDS